MVVPKSLRDAVWRKYIGTSNAYGKCYVCSKEIHIQDWDVGHNKARVKGGTNNLVNLRPICRPCNSSMGTMSIETYKKKFKPIRNKSAPKKRRQSYRCKLSTTGKVLYCGKKRADKTCLKAPTIFITGKCPELIISRR